MSSNPYAEFKARIESNKNHTFNFGVPWLRLVLVKDEIRLIHWSRSWKNRESPEFNVDDPTVIFTPDNICTLVGDTTPSITLARMGIPGQFLHIGSPKSEIIYRHRMMYDYEAQYGMQLSMHTGKPIGMRLLTDIKYNEEKRRILTKRINKLKIVWCGIQRIEGGVLPDRATNEYGIHQTRIKDNKTLYDMLQSDIDNPHRLSPSWRHDLAIIVGRFKRNAYNQKEADLHHLFDNMVKFHKSALYRKYGVIS